MYVVEICDEDGNQTACKFVPGDDKLGALENIAKLARQRGGETLTGKKTVYTKVGGLVEVYKIGGKVQE